MDVCHNLLVTSGKVRDCFHVYFDSLFDSGFSMSHKSGPWEVTARLHVGFRQSVSTKRTGGADWSFLDLLISIPAWLIFQVDPREIGFGYLQNLNLEANFCLAVLCLPVWLLTQQLGTSFAQFSSSYGLQADPSARAS